MSPWIWRLVVCLCLLTFLGERAASIIVMDHLQRWQSVEPAIIGQAGKKKSRKSVSPWIWRLVVCLCLLTFLGERAASIIVMDRLQRWQSVQPAIIGQAGKKKIP